MKAFSGGVGMAEDLMGEKVGECNLLQLAHIKEDEVVTIIGSSR